MTDLTTRNRVGLVIAGLLGAADLTSLAFITDDGDVGPPLGILIFTTICGVVTIAALVPAWRSGNRVAIRAVAGSRVLSAITALPAFFVDIEPALVVITAALIVLTVVAVILMLTPERTPAPVLD